MDVSICVFGDKASKLMKTPLYDWHRAHNGRIVDFAGWELPIQYTSIVDEHHAVRKAAGIFDIAHMGRLYLEGNGATEFLNSLVTIDVSKLKPGQVKYALVTNDQGGVLDDILINCRDQESFLLVVNASNREKIVSWIQQHLPKSGDIEFHDETINELMLAIQGPQAVSIVSELLNDEVAQMKYYTFHELIVNDQRLVLSRTGYTGEDGFEMIIDADHGVWLWETLMQLGEPVGLKPAGLGCRDTLRLEAAMPLYGHELNETTDPLSADLGFAVKLDKPDFHGKSQLEAIKAAGVNRRRVGLIFEGKRIPREGIKLYDGENLVGEITSGTFSPTLEKTIAMAMMEKAYLGEGTHIEADLRGARIPAVVTKLPFYQRAR